MGVLVDYFAATTEELAQLELSAGPAGANWPCVDCKGWLDGLDSLTAEVTERDPSEFDDDTLVVDDGETCMVRVSSSVTAAIASVDDDRLREYAEDELLDDHEVARLTALRDLAKLAVEAGRDIYCWMCP
jgi:hypothetical protein